MNNRTAALGMLTGTIRQVISVAAGLVTVPIVARALGPEGFGVWAILGTTAFLLGVVDLGTTTAVQRAAVAGDMDLARRRVRLSLFIVAVLGPLVALLSYAWVQRLPVPANVRGTLRIASAVALLGGAVSGFVFPIRGYLLARGDVASVTVSRILAVVVQLGIVVVGFACARSLIVPAVALAASLSVELAYCAHRARLLDPNLALLPAFPQRWLELQEPLREGAASLSINLGAALALRLDVVLLAEYAPLSVVASYGIASRAIDQSFTIAKQVSTALMPHLGRKESRAEAVRLGTAVLGAVMASGGAALVIGGGPLLTAWAGPAAERPEALPALALLAGAATLAATHELASSAILYGGRSAWGSASPLVVGYVVNLGVSVAFVSHAGVWAVAGGTLLGNGITSVLIWRRAGALLEWPRRQIGQALLPAGGALVAAVVAGTIIGQLPSSGVAWAMVACVGTATIGCAAAVGVWRWA